MKRVTLDTGMGFVYIDGTRYTQQSLKEKKDKNKIECKVLEIFEMLLEKKVNYV